MLYSQRIDCIPKLSIPLYKDKLCEIHNKSKFFSFSVSVYQYLGLMFSLCSYKVGNNQSFLYRLSGDYNPLHIGLKIKETHLYLSYICISLLLFLSSILSFLCSLDPEWAKLVG